MEKLKTLIGSDFGIHWYHEVLSKVEKGVEEFNGYGLIDVYDPEEVLLVVKDEELIGFGIVHGKNRNCGYFGPIGIKESYRSKKIGTILLYRLIEILHRKGVKRVKLYTKADTFQSNQYYPKAGFKTIWYRYQTL